MHPPHSDQEYVVWDVLDPFAPVLDPTQRRLRALIHAEIMRTRKYESIGPLQPIEDASDTESDSDSDDESDDDGDADDEEEDDDGKEELPARISLPRLLHTHPICYVSSGSPSPTPSTSTGESTHIGPLRDLSSTDEDEAEAKERARKAKRDAHRSRLKVLAVLGPEAATVFSMSHGSQF